MSAADASSAPHRPLAILTGPTAVGKTEVAVDVALALGTEIISADSMAVYRRMEAATAKPSAAQRARVPHHLIDVADPTELFTVADYLRLAIPLIERLLGEGKTPLVVGGTRLYLVALTQPFDVAAPPQPALRAAWSEVPSEALHARLQKVDPDTAARVHPHDRKRIVRALEVFEATGVPLSVWQRQSQYQPGRYAASTVVLIRDRAELYRRVDERVDAMLAAGLVGEVRGFLAEGLGPDTPAMQGHGYKEIIRALLGEYSLAEGIRLLKRNTRRYVKYQLMWLHRWPGLHWVRADRPHAEGVAECVRIFQTETAVEKPNAEGDV
ncbi:MAG: tRNA (adenosine(37)-N6)-dimethylallyltransferase MiaA [Armatimonadetes bacterium]|nr:tRNA (adenosine(37)-N6)-dimethylallyltransferase MiaA [Armatimonadota bacterium]